MIIGEGGGEIMKSDALCIRDLRYNVYNARLSTLRQITMQLDQRLQTAGYNASNMSFCCLVLLLVGSESGGFQDDREGTSIFFNACKSLVA